MPCRVCGRIGDCRVCCCVHPWHRRSASVPRQPTCPLCSHDDGYLARMTKHREQKTTETTETTPSTETTTETTETTETRPSPIEHDGGSVEVETTETETTTER